MTKADIVDRLTSSTGFSKKESYELVELIFETMKSTLESEDNLKISGFGNFIVRQKAARRGRNPQTGEEITIKSRRGNLRGQVCLFDFLGIPQFKLPDGRGRLGCVFDKVNFRYQV